MPDQQFICESIAGDCCMLSRRVYIKVLIGLVWTSMLLVGSSAFAQTPTTVAARTEKAEKKVAADEPRPTDLQTEITNLKTENAAVRELLRKMEEQQKTLLDQVDRLQKRLDGNATVTLQPVVPEANTVDPDAQPADAATVSNKPDPPPVKQDDPDDHYRD